MSRAKASGKPKAADSRRQLFGAFAIVRCCRYALDSQLNGLDVLTVGDALQVAADIIDNVAEALDGGAA